MLGREKLIERPWPIPEVTNMALFCDFENVALGVQDAKYERFDIGKCWAVAAQRQHRRQKSVLRWDRYKAFKAPMHEASFELIEIPHVAIGQKFGRHTHGRRRADLCAIRSRTSRHS
jgi:hypothetical protein